MDTKFSLLTYFLVVAMRVTSFRRRWDMPLMYGPRYFYRLHVGEGFYFGAGRRLLQRYRVLLLWPYFAELVAFTVLMAHQNYKALTALCGVGLIATALNQRLSLALVTRSAKKFEETEIDPAPAAVTFSLNPRRLAGYTHPVFEIVLGSVITLTLIFLGQMHAHMGPPLLLLYLQIGFLLLKKAIVDWRAAAPLENSELYLEVRERRRKLLLFACDFYRGALGFVMIKQAVFQVTTDERWRWTLQYLYLGLSIASVCFAIVKTNELYAMYRKIKPTRVRGGKRLTPPDPNGFVAGGLLYFDPDNPAILVQGPRSVALNAGNHRLLLAATYLVGLMLLIMWTSKAHAATCPEAIHQERADAMLFHTGESAGCPNNGTVTRTSSEFALESITRR
jgi:hypothetical protein